MEGFFLHIDPGSNLVSVLQVPFTEVLDLVSKRKVYLEDGFAYVSRDDMMSIVMTYYRSHLSHSLAVGLLDLVSKRKVYLEDGFAYVSRDDMISIVMKYYRSHLSHSLVVSLLDLVRHNFT